MKHNTNKKLQLQDDALELYKNNEWNTASVYLLVAMQEELGELAARWLAECKDYKKSLVGTDTLEDCVGDLGLLLLAFCNKDGINFDTAVKASIKIRSKQK